MRQALINIYKKKKNIMKIYTYKILLIANDKFVFS